MTHSYVKPTRDVYMYKGFAEINQAVTYINESHVALINESCFTQVLGKRDHARPAS